MPKKLSQGEQENRRYRKEVAKERREKRNLEAERRKRDRRQEAKWDREIRDAREEARKRERRQEVKWQRERREIQEERARRERKWKASQHRTAKKGLFEPDYRRKGWNRNKGRSRSVFALSNVLGGSLSLVLLVLFFGWLLNPKTVFLATGIIILPLLTFPLLARLLLNRTLDDNGPSQIVDEPEISTSTAISQPAVPLTPAYNLSPFDFEREIAWVFTQLYGVRAELVGGTGDGGIDIKLYDQAGMLIAIVQAKRYDPKKTLNPIFLRDLDSCHRRLGVRWAFLVTTARFSEDTRQQARDMRVSLIGGAKFEELRCRAHGARIAKVTELQCEMLAQTPPIPEYPSQPQPVDTPYSFQPGVPVPIQRQLDERMKRLNLQ